MDLTVLTTSIVIECLEGSYSNLPVSHKVMRQVYLNLRTYTGDIAVAPHSCMYSLYSIVVKPLLMNNFVSLVQV